MSRVDGAGACGLARSGAPINRVLRSPARRHAGALTPSAISASTKVDLSHLDLGGSAEREKGSERLYPALGFDDETLEAHDSGERLARREGLEPPTLRFEA